MIDGEQVVSPYEFGECEPWRQGWELMKPVSHDVEDEMFTWQTMVFEPDEGGAHRLTVSFGDAAYETRNSASRSGPKVMEWAELFRHADEIEPAPAPHGGPLHLKEDARKVLHLVVTENIHGRKPSVPRVARALDIPASAAKRLVTELAGGSLIRPVTVGRNTLLEVTALGKRVARR